MTEQKLFLFLLTTFLAGWLFPIFLALPTRVLLNDVICILAILHWVLLWVFLYQIINPNLSKTNSRIDIFNNVVTSKKINVIQK